MSPSCVMKNVGLVWYLAVCYLDHGDNVMRLLSWEKDTIVLKEKKGEINYRLSKFYKTQPLGHI